MICAGEGGGGTAIYGLYMIYEVRAAVYYTVFRLFSSSLLWDRVYESESLGLEKKNVCASDLSIVW